MTRWFVSLLLNALALTLVSQLFDAFYLEGVGTALLASVILSILNFIVKPILVVLTLPITIVSLGLFLFVINAITLMITQSLIGNSFVIDGFGVAIIAAIVLALINLILNRLIKDQIT
ncbi:phage holin family protein [Paraliobacillus salinarum]|uniref:phage holin family protein n=1 Tax=Paraliobacillus salinarum TaxID=1158996 RepID=UPI0015F76489|nr:phage holin family protein [Paraliobacillus salinarum]